MVADRRDWTTVSFEEGRERLKEWREENARRSEEVVELWEHVLSRSPSSLADELCTVYEQVCIAALDCSRTDLAHECINALHKRFPGSSQVLRLQAMFYEARGQWKTAEGIYEKLIGADETNPAYRKRRVAMLLRQGKRLEAIKALNEHLGSFITDSEAWLQLSELYLGESDYARAAHAMEEVLVTAPTNSIYLRRLADIRYTQASFEMDRCLHGGQENLEVARAYYDQALKFSPVYVRALYGVVLSCNSLVATARLTADKKKEYSTAAAAALQRIAERFPGSSQVLRLQAMFYEARGQWKTAEGIYEKLIGADETNPEYRKRRVAMLLRQGKQLEAIKALNDRLKMVADRRDWTTVSFEEGTEALKEWREEHARRSEEGISAAAAAASSENPPDSSLLSLFTLMDSALSSPVSLYSPQARRINCSPVDYRNDGIEGSFYSKPAPVTRTTPLSAARSGTKDSISERKLPLRELAMQPLKEEHHADNEDRENMRPEERQKSLTSDAASDSFDKTVRKPNSTTLKSASSNGPISNFQRRSFPEGRTVWSRKEHEERTGTRDASGEEGGGEVCRLPYQYKSQHNIGNSCYMNATLQVLAACPLFVMQVDQAKESLKKPSFFFNRFGASMMWLNGLHISKAPVSKGLLEGLRTDLMKLDRVFEEGDGMAQQDAEEALTAFLGAVSDECTGLGFRKRDSMESRPSQGISSPVKTPNPIKRRSGEGLPAVGEEQSKTKMMPATCDPVDLMEVQMRDVRTCRSCGHVNYFEAAEHRVHLGVGVAEKKTKPWTVKCVEQLLAAEVAVEEIITDYGCEKCATKGIEAVGTKQFVVFGEYIIIVLKRFGHDENHRLRKLTMPIRVPIYLEMADFLGGGRAVEHNPLNKTIDIDDNETSVKKGRNEKKEEVKKVDPAEKMKKETDNRVDLPSEDEKVSHEKTEDEEEKEGNKTMKDDGEKKDEEEEAAEEMEIVQLSSSASAEIVHDNPAATEATSLETQDSDAFVTPITRSKRAPRLETPGTVEVTAMMRPETEKFKATPTTRKRVRSPPSRGDERASTGSRLSLSDTRLEKRSRIEERKKLTGSALLEGNTAVDQKEEPEDPMEYGSQEGGFVKEEEEEAECSSADEVVQATPPDAIEQEEEKEGAEKRNNEVKMESMEEGKEEEEEREVKTETTATETDATTEELEASFSGLSIDKTSFEKAFETPEWNERMAEWRTLFKDTDPSPPRDYMTFRPVDDRWMMDMSKQLHLDCVITRYVQHPVFAELRAQSNLCPVTAKPQADDIIKMDGDGNCLFRAISWWVTGAEAGHELMRFRIVDFMVKFPDQFGERMSGEPGRKYTKEDNDRMLKDGEWGTQCEIYGAATLLGVDIYTYHQKRWKAHRPLFEWTLEDGTPQVIRKMGFTERTRFALYLTNPENVHYDVVKYMKPVAPMSDTCYRLLATILHKGETFASGHYLADVYDQEKDQWVHCDDERITKREILEVLEDAMQLGYVFIYGKNSSVLEKQKKKK